MQVNDPTTQQPEKSTRLLLRPAFDQDGNAEFIDVCMELVIESKEIGEALFDHILARGPTLTTQYSAADVHVTREDGSQTISIAAEDSKDARRRTFSATEGLAAGMLAVRYRATPRLVTENSPCGPQIALERDGGGLSACGQGFLLGPAKSDRDTRQKIVIEWDLAHAPTGTRAVSTFGEGSRVEFHETPAVLDETFFMVGKINSYPTDTTGQAFGTYWLSNPPFDASKIGSHLSTVLPRIQKLFEDDDPLYRVFIRRNEYKCISGRGLHQGFVFAWNPIWSQSEDGLVEFLFHEIVHNWPRLGGRGHHGSPTTEDLCEAWWNEGIAEYYSLVIPFRLGIFSENEFVYRVNRRISGYYTNPDRDLRNDQIMERFWKTGHANRIPYQRGFMFFVLLSHKLNAAGKRSLDELILDMVKRRQNGDAHDITIWHDLITAELGEDAMTDWRNMSAAQLFRLPSDCLSTFVHGARHRWTLSREDQEEYYLGFPEPCLTASKRKVEGLDPDSRAAKAGVREGDVITSRFSFPTEAELWDGQFAMTVQRDEDVDLKWWPRSFAKVESYQFKRVDE